MTIPEKVMAAIEALPPLSRAANEILALVNDPKHSLKQIETVVSVDPVLTAKLLQLANSANYARRTPAASVRQAVLVLGERLVAGVALSIGGRAVYGGDLSGYDAARGSLWRHCLLAALAGRELAAFAGKEVEAGVAYTAGLLHDIGKAVISLHFCGSAPETLDRLEERAENDFLATERELVGCDHGEVGAVLAERWQLPPALVAAIRHHHRPSEAPEAYRPIAYVTHLADFVAMMEGVGTGVDLLRYPLDANYARYVPLQRRDLERCICTVELEYEKLMVAFEQVMER